MDLWNQLVSGGIRQSTHTLGVAFFILDELTLLFKSSRLLATWRGFAVAIATCRKDKSILFVTILVVTYSS